MSETNNTKLSTSDITRNVSDSDLADIVNKIDNADTKLLAQLLIEVKKENAKQAEQIKKQTIFSIVSACACAVLALTFIIIGAKIVPTVNAVAAEATGLMQNANGLVTEANGVVADVSGQVSGVIDEANAMLGTASTVIDNLATVTSNAAESDISGIVDNVNSLVVTSEESMKEAVDKINEIDLDSLNGAISDLSSVVSPLAKLFKK